MEKGSISFIVGMIIFLFFAWIMLIISQFNCDEPFRAVFWHFVKKNKAVQAHAHITECRVIQWSNCTPSDNGCDIRYYPVVDVQYESNNRTYTSRLILNRRGYLTPDSAFADVIKTAPEQKIKLIYTFSDEINPDEGDFYKHLRINENTKKTNIISLYVNPDNPQEHEYLYKGFTIDDWLGFAIPMSFALICIAVPLFLFIPIPFKLRLISTIITLLASVLMHSFLSTQLPKLSGKYHIRKSSLDDTPKFEIMIDSNYDGSQSEPYIQKLY